MTIRAILLGLLGAALICGLTYFNDAVIHQTYLVGNNMPVSVYGGLILLLLLVNPLLFRLAKRAAFSGRELAVVLALTLAACVVPGSGLLRTFTCGVILPHQFARTEPGWKEQGVLQMAPPQMLADVSQHENDVLGGFVQGLAVGGRHISLAQVPWYAWVRPLLFWVPLILLLWFGLIALAVVVHRQWSDHEQLPYPVAKFTQALLPGEGQARGAVFRDRLFWIGAAVVIVIHLNNYACQWFPRSLISIPTMFDFRSLQKLFPANATAPNMWKIFTPAIYFSVIAFAYFLATDVSFSLGVGPVFYSLAAGLLTQYGVSVEAGGWFGPGLRSFFVFGAFLGVLLALLYTGRHYYGTVARRAVCLPAASEVESAAVWGGRLFLLCFVGSVIWLMAAGLDWQLGVLFLGCVVLTFVVLARVMAETGCFFIQAGFYPSAILMGVFGAQALGPHIALLTFLLCAVLVIDPREALLPFVVNSLKLTGEYKLPMGRIAFWCAVAVLVGLAVGLPVTLYFQYDRGCNLSDGWSTQFAPAAPFNEAVAVKQRLTAQGSLEEASRVSGWGRFAALSPNKPCVTALVIGLVLVLACTAGRLRFPKWPLHPVMFVVWHTYPGSWFSHSFLLGCVIKVLVTKYGGARLYQRLKPLMFGLIAGDMLGGGLPALIGFVYYLVTGEIPKTFRVLPT